MRECVWRNLGRVEYAAALAVQQDCADRRKRGEIPDQLLFVEHPHVITLGRNARPENLLAPEEHLRNAGIALYRTDRGGDVTYHGPGQLVGYPIVDLRQWKRDVAAYLRAVEEVLIGALAEFGIEGGRQPGMTGVWVKGAKIAAIGVHISRWVTTHGFALNISTDLRYFQYIIPCGLSGRPVTSMQQVRAGHAANGFDGAPGTGHEPLREHVMEAVARSFGRVFERGMREEAEAGIGGPQSKLIGGREAAGAAAEAL